MDQPNISAFIVDRPPDAPSPQAFYPPPPPPVVFTAVPRADLVRPKKQDGTATVLAVLIALVVVAIIYVVFFRRRERGLVHELVASGWVLYTRPGCPYCVRQMDALGVKKYPREVVCIGSTSSASGTMSDSQGPLKCSNVNVFPYWHNTFSNATRTGLQSRADLERMARETRR